MNLLLIADTNLPSGVPGAVRGSALLGRFRNKFRDIFVIETGKHQSAKIENTPVKSNYVRAFRKSSIQLNSRIIDSSVISKQFIIDILFMIRIRARKQKVDCIYASYKPGKALILGVIAKLIFRGVLIMEYRDLAANFADSERANLMIKFDNWIERLCNNWIDQVVVVGKTQCDNYKKVFTVEPLIVRNGIDHNVEVKPRFQLRENEAESTLKICYSGTLSKRRNLMAIEKWGLENCELTIFSKQKPDTFLSLHSSMSFIKYQGFRSRDHVKNEYENTDCFLLIEGYGVSSYENIPSKVFEYLAYKKPILFCGSMNSDVADILMQSGFLIHIDENGRQTDYTDETNYRTHFSSLYREKQLTKLDRYLECKFLMK